MTTPLGPNQHRCPGGCGRPVNARELACPSDWYRLPPALRAAIWRAWRSGALVVHRGLVVEALAWFRENPRLTAPAGQP